MAGQFAHISLVNSVCGAEGLDSLGNMMRPLAAALCPRSFPYIQGGDLHPQCPRQDLQLGIGDAPKLRLDLRQRAPAQIPPQHPASSREVFLLQFLAVAQPAHHRRGNSSRG